MQTEKRIDESLDGQDRAPAVRIQDLSSSEHLRDLEDLQVLVWGGAPSTIVPVHVLHIVATTGGIVLGAYDGDQPVGFAFGFLGRRNGRLYHASHMLGVHPAYQGRGLGAALKMAQRERALQQGLDLMTWTFDPLESRNAYFNIHKLGVISRRYTENVYGELDDNLNRGLPSDRIVVEWWLNDVKSDRKRAPNEAVTILASYNGLPSLRLEHQYQGQDLRVDVPEDIQRVKRDSPELALEWR
ncbi:MAG: GNAT family N-acetyltransferase, partial [Chloroflexota bacterium]